MVARTDRHVLVGGDTRANGSQRVRWVAVASILEYLEPGDGWAAVVPTQVYLTARDRGCGQVCRRRRSSRVDSQGLRVGWAAPRGRVDDRYRPRTDSAYIAGEYSRGQDAGGGVEACSSGAAPYLDRRVANEARALDHQRE